MFGKFSAAAILLSRALMASVFLFFGVVKIVDPVLTAALIAAEGFPWPLMGAISAGAIEILGGGLLLLGLVSRPAALMLVLYLIPVTVLFHSPVGADPELQQTHVLKNLAIMGGLLMLAGYGPGAYSLDDKRRRREATRDSSRPFAHAV